MQSRLIAFRSRAALRKLAAEPPGRVLRSASGARSVFAPERAVKVWRFRSTSGPEIPFPFSADRPIPLPPPPRRWRAKQSGHLDPLFDESDLTSFQRHT